MSALHAACSAPFHFIDALQDRFTFFMFAMGPTAFNLLLPAAELQVGGVSAEALLCVHVHGWTNVEDHFVPLCGLPPAPTADLYMHGVSYIYLLTAGCQISCEAATGTCPFVPVECCRVVLSCNN